MTASGLYQVFILVSRVTFISVALTTSIPVPVKPAFKTICRHLLEATFDTIYASIVAPPHSLQGWNYNTLCTCCRFCPVIYHFGAMFLQTPFTHTKNATADSMHAAYSQIYSGSSATNGYENPWHFNTLHCNEICEVLFHIKNVPCFFWGGGTLMVLV